MKSFFSLSLLVLAATPAAIAQCYFPISSSIHGPEIQYDLVVVVDGYIAPCYSPQPIPQHLLDAVGFRNYLMGLEPFATYANFISIHGIHRTSVQAGADHPELLTPTFVNSAYNSTYNNGGTARCVLMSNTSGQNGGNVAGLALAFADAASTAPGFDGHVLALVNDATYGGCAIFDSHAAAYNGNAVPNAAQVAVHEFGHLMGLLGDEYGGAGTYSGAEPVEANLTSMLNPLKWAIWIGTGGISSNPPAGGRGFNTGIYHPKTSCMMNTATQPFCEVCREQLVKRIYFYADSIVSTTPPDTQPISVTQGGVLALSFTHRVPTSAATIPGAWPAPTISWSVDGVQVLGAATTSFNLNTTALTPGPHQVIVAIRDNTPFVRTNTAGDLVRQREWTVNVQAPMPDLQMLLFAHVEPTVAAGSNVTLYGEVDNLGTGAAGGFTVEFFLSVDSVIDPSTDYYVGNHFVAGLLPGSNDSFALPFQTPFHLGAGPWYLGAIADRLNNVAESIETNNSLVDAVPLSLTTPAGCPIALEFDAPLSFLGHFARISNSAGGSRILRITAPCNPGELYLIGVSATGTVPGTVLGPNLVLPLVYDSLTATALGYVNSVPLLGFGGTLDTLGRASANLALPPGFFGSGGFKVYFASAIYVLGAGGVTFTAATNPLELLIDP